MKAIWVSEFAGPEVLKLEDMPDPRPLRPEEAQIGVKAGVNPYDTYAILRLRLRPTTPGVGCRRLQNTCQPLNEACPKCRFFVGYPRRFWRRVVQTRICMRSKHSQGVVGWKWWMTWRWIVVLGVASSVWVSGAQTQQQPQVGGACGG
jgi:hypothetical protein